MFSARHLSHLNRKKGFSIFEIPLHIKRSPYDELNLLTGHFLFLYDSQKTPKGVPPPTELLYHTLSLTSEKVFPVRGVLQCQWQPRTRRIVQKCSLPAAEEVAEISITLSEWRHGVTDRQERVYLNLFNPTEVPIKGFFAAQFYRDTTLDLIHGNKYWQWYQFHTRYEYLRPLGTAKIRSH